MVPRDASQSVGPRILAHNDIVLWCATARPLAYQELSTATLAYGPSTSSRTSQEVFMRGLKERIQITTTTGTAWFWRRVCFQRKAQFNPADVVLGNYVNVDLPTGGGRLQYTMYRSVQPLAPAERAALTAFLFQGNYGDDWYSYTNASVDKLNVSVYFDRTVTINSGNDQGVTRMFNLWHTMNKNMYYNDREVGGDIVEKQIFANPGHAGMGDYYVMDFFTNSVPNGDNLTFLPEATLYWHER